MDRGSGGEMGTNSLEFTQLTRLLLPVTNQCACTINDDQN